MDGTPGTTTKLDDKTGLEPAVRCARCGHVVTKVSERLEVHGRHAHTFMNPVGVVYEIVCYRTADGARVGGAPESDTSWFPGTAWVYAWCGGCGTQLGWSYVALEGPEAGAGRFFGLIAERIVAGR